MWDPHIHREAPRGPHMYMGFPYTYGWPQGSPKGYGTPIYTWGFHMSGQLYSTLRYMGLPYTYGRP